MSKRFLWTSLTLFALSLLLAGQRTAPPNRRTPIKPAQTQPADDSAAAKSASDADAAKASAKAKAREAALARQRAEEAAKQQQADTAAAEQKQREIDAAKARAREAARSRGAVAKPTPEPPRSVATPPARGDVQPKTTRLTAEQTASLRAAFERDGWSPSNSDEPDLAVLRLDRTAARAKRREFLRQLASGSFGPADLDRVANLAKSADDEALQEEAVGVLVRSPSPRAQSLLIDTFRSARNESIRLQIVGGLRPKSDSDEAGKFLASQLSDTKASPSIKRVAARSLAAGIARKQRGGRVSDASMRNLSAQDRAQINDALTKVRTAGRLHDHKSAPSANVRGGALKAARPGAPRLDNSVIETINRFRERRNQPHFWAVKVNAEGRVVPARGDNLRSSGGMRHVLVVPTGYTADDYQKFVDGFNKMVSDMGNLPERVFTSKYRDRIVYIAHWIPGGTIDSGDANFSPTLYEHPVRGGRGISMNNRRLIEAVDNFKAEHLPTSDPIGVMVVFNIDDDDVTANAVCPTFLGRPYGIARITHEDILDDSDFAALTWGHYVPMHELGHGAINWLDEYFEDMLDGWDINSTDPLTGLLLPDGSWQGWTDAWETAISNYTIRMSEVLGDNGSDNISLRRTTSRVDSPGFDPLIYETSGGMFFPIGTRHDEGNNVMNDSFLPDQETLKADGNRFAWDHSPQQDALLDFVFGVTSKAPRPNDRIRCAGPMHNWLPQWGDQVRLLIFDADKNHRWHKTTKYEVEVGWWEWDWGRGDWAWKSMARTVTPSARDVDLSRALVGDGVGILRDILVANGVSDVPTGENAGFNLAALTVDELVNTTLPAVRWPTPYQDVRVTLPIPAYQYYWRFRTYNGHHWSGFTGWSGFFKI